MDDPDDPILEGVRSYNPGSPWDGVHDYMDSCRITLERGSDDLFRGIDFPIRLNSVTTHNEQINR